MADSWLATIALAVASVSGADAMKALAKLYASLRLYINFFQPSFKLKSKTRDGAHVHKVYRGLPKNATRAFTALALANIYLGRQSLLAQVRP